MMPQPPKERTAGNSWPEWPRVLKVDYGQTECMAKFGKDPRVYQTTVKEFLKDDAGSLTAAVISYLKPERDPETGRTNMVPTGESSPTTASWPSLPPVSWAVRAMWPMPSVSA